MPKFSAERVPVSPESREKRREAREAPVISIDRAKLKRETESDEAHRLDAAFKALQKMSDGESPREVLTYLAKNKKVTAERLRTVKSYLEMVEMKKADEKKTETHSANFALITSIEDALSEPTPDRMSALLSSALKEADLSPGKRGSESEAHQALLANRIKELTGKTPEQLLNPKSSVLGSVVGWLRKISGQADPAQDKQVKKLLDEWNQASQTQAAAEAWTPPAPGKKPEIIETLSAEDIINEEPAKTPEQTLAHLEADLEIAKKALGAARGEEMREWAKEVKRLERQRESMVGEMRGQGKKIEPTLKEQETERQSKAKAEKEFQAKVQRATELLPGGQAYNISQDVLGQLGVANWEKATQKQRDAASDYVFKVAEYQAALNAGNEKDQTKLAKDLKALEKSIGLSRSPYFQPSGHAGVGVTLESGRQSIAGAAARVSGGEARSRSTVRARKTVNEAPPIAAVDQEAVLMTGAKEAKKVVSKAEESIDLVKKSAAEAIAKAKLQETIEAGIKAAKAAVAGQEKTIAALKESAAEAQAKAMTIDKAKNIVPDADKLWDLVSTTLKKKPEAEKKIAGLKKYGVGDAATTYVLAMARYLEAVNQPAPLAAIRSLEDSLDKANAALGLGGNALVQRIMAERGKKFGKAVGRRVKGASRQEETRRGGKTL